MYKCINEILYIINEYQSEYVNQILHLTQNEYDVVSESDYEESPLSNDVEEKLKESESNIDNEKIYSSFIYNTKL